jgi:hypothetical protein
MSASESHDRDAIQRYGTIIVVGGGCYASYYVRQLRRAVRAGALEAQRIVVVDRDANCAVAREMASSAPDELRVDVITQDWSRFFADYLSSAVEAPARHRDDAIVPSPLMPHLMGEWLVTRARERFGDRVVADQPFEHLPDVPWSRAGGPGTHYVSFATWTCPINCVEPRTCPHTRDTRTWSLPVRLGEFAREQDAARRPVVVATLFCRHRSYGVGMFDTAEVIDAHHRIMAAGERGAAEVVIGTVSHCHGALSRLVIRETDAIADSPVP